MSRPWMPLYIADYLRDTRKLTTAEHGAYLLLIMEYWTAGELPADDRQLARIVGLTAPEWRKAKPNVQAFFTEGWRHKRINKELAKSNEISSKRSASAKQRGSKSSANAEQLDTHAGATSQSQIQSQERKQDAEAAPSAPIPSDEADFYRRIKQIAGASAGGLGKRLLTAKDGNVALARAAVEQASTKQDPREYLGAIIRTREEPECRPDRSF